MTGIPRFESVEEQLREQHGTPGDRIFTVSGLAGVGTSTVATFLANEFNLERINAGDFFRQKAKEYDMSLQEFDKRTEELEKRENTDFDLEWDRTALEYAFTKDNILLEGRIAGALLADIAPVRVKVTCDTDVAAKRIHRREDLSIEEAEKYLTVRNQEVLQRYQDKYGINPRDDQYYNVVVGNSQSFDRVKEELVEQVQTVLQRSQ